jgi:hypothetical protein
VRTIASMAGYEPRNQPGADSLELLQAVVQPVRRFQVETPHGQ